MASHTCKVSIYMVDHNALLEKLKSMTVPDRRLPHEMVKKKQEMRRQFSKQSSEL